MCVVFCLTSNKVQRPKYNVFNMSKEKKSSFKEQFAALRNIPALFKIIWRTHRGLMFIDNIKSHAFGLALLDPSLQHPDDVLLVTHSQLQADVVQQDLQLVVS